jgi:isopenicillin-N N-acyltransferase-like protein
MNEEGIAIGTTNLRTKDARPGVGYLSIIHKALAERELAAAEAAVTKAHRAGGHYYYLADRKNHAVAYECSATLHERVEVTRGHQVQTNHVQSARIRELEADTPAASSKTRRERLVELIEADAKAGIDLEAAKRYFADGEHGANAICRDDFAGISTNGAVLIVPARPALLMTHGLPSAGTWIDALA